MTLLKITPSWKQFVVFEGRRNTPTIYSRAIKALYGTLDAVKLFFDNLSGYLRDELGFKSNPYDSCVMNKFVNGSQCIVIFHVDDLKISHEDSKVVTEVIDSLSNRYGELMPLSISRGRTHDYLGMTFNYSSPGQVTIHMYQYLKDFLENVPDRYKEGVGSATQHLIICTS